MENFLPGTMQRWRLDYEQDLAQVNPRLIYCSISGFGADGPLGKLPGYDAVAQAACGLMSVNGDQDRVANRDSLIEVVNAQLRDVAAEALCSDLMSDGIPASVVRSVAQALEHPHARTRGSVASIGRWRALASAVRLSRTPATIRNLPPALDAGSEAAWH